MSSNETTLGAIPASNTYMVSKTISVPTRPDETALISFEIVAMLLNDTPVDEGESQMVGQCLLWLIAVIYLALVLALYYGVYVVLNAVSSLGGSPANAIH
ncbi:MAG: hypothetical protein M3362_01830 [Acidobacteriota bacterium]|nr:hypothetical protein [Acidobacteriota bacterium]